MGSGPQDRMHAAELKEYLDRAEKPLPAGWVAQIRVAMALGFVPKGKIAEKMYRREIQAGRLSVFDEIPLANVTESQYHMVKVALVIARVGSAEAWAKMGLGVKDQQQVLMRAMMDDRAAEAMWIRAQGVDMKPGMIRRAVMYGATAVLDALLAAGVTCDRHKLSAVRGPDAELTARGREWLASHPEFLTGRPPPDMSAYKRKPFTAGREPAWEASTVETDI